jgi:hypothetical protein
MGKSRVNRLYRASNVRGGISRIKTTTGYGHIWCFKNIEKAWGGFSIESTTSPAHVLTWVFRAGEGGYFTMNRLTLTAGQV